MREIELSSSVDDFDLDLRIHVQGPPPRHVQQVEAKDTDFTCTVPERTWQETCEHCSESDRCNVYSNFESTCQECRTDGDGDGDGDGDD